MKILVCHNYYRERGGEDQFFEDEAILLQSHGHEVIRHTIHNDNIKVSKLPAIAAKTLWNRGAAQNLTELIERHQPDVLHVVNTFPQLSPAIFYAANAANVPTVASVQNYRAFCAQAMCFRDGKACEACLGKIPWRAVKYGCYRGSRSGSAVVAGMQMLHRFLKTWQTQIDIICVASEFSRSKLKAAGFIDDQMMTKPNFVSNDPGLQSGDGKFALFVGRVAGEKGVDTVIKAWQEHGLKYPLKIVGDGPDREQLERLGSSNPNIEWIGRVPNEQVYDWMGRAACLVFPSIGYESMPKTLIESMAVGTPVIGANVASIPEVVQHGETGFVFEGGNADDLAKQVTRFFDEEAMWPKMRADCRDQFDRRFTAETNYRLLMSMYSEAMRRKGIVLEAESTEDVRTTASASISRV